MQRFVVAVVYDKKMRRFQSHIPEAFFIIVRIPLLEMEIAALYFVAGYWLYGIALHRKSISELWSITFHVGSHSVTCHPTQVNARQVGTRFTYPKGMEG